MNDGTVCGNGSFRVVTRAPVLLHVSKETRNLALPYYQEVLPQKSTTNRKVEYRYTYFNPAKDTLLLGQNICFHNMAEIFEAGDVFKKVIFILNDKDDTIKENEDKVTSDCMRAHQIVNVLHGGIERPRSRQFRFGWGLGCTDLEEFSVVVPSHVVSIPSSLLPILNFSFRNPAYW